MIPERILPRVQARQGVPPSMAIVLLFVVYFVSAKIGLLLAFVHPSATAVWPPTGVALAALILFGYELWPGIFLGAFFVNLTTGGSIGTACGIALGNTLEALAGTYLLNRFGRGRHAFDRPQDVLKFAALAGVVSTALSSTIGVTTLYFGGLADLAEYYDIWFTWWLGDMGGALILAPALILLGANPRFALTTKELWERGIVLALLATAGFLAFALFRADDLRSSSTAFLTIPILLWSAVRFGRKESAAAVLVVATIAIWGTLRGDGPFVRQDPNESLLLLQEFGATLAVMVLMIAAAIHNRNRMEAALRASDEMARKHLAELQTIYRSAPVGLGLTDRDLRFLSVNQTLAEIDGISTSDHIGRTLSEIVPPSLAQTLEPLYRRVLDTGEPVLNVEVQGETKARPAVTRQWSVNYHPVFGDDRAIGVSIMVQEITERKRSEEALRQSEERLASELAATSRLHALSSRLLSARDLTTALDDVLENAIVTCDADFGNIQLFNPQTEALEIVVQRGFREDFLSHFRSVRLDNGSACARAMNTGRRVLIEDVSLDAAYEPHHRIAAAAGYRAVQSTPLKTHDGRIVGILSTHFRTPHRLTERDQRLLDLYARDAAELVERKRADEITARLAAIVDNSDDAIISKDLNGVILSWNNGAERLFGYTAQEAIGQPVTLLMPDGVDEEPAILERIRRGERIRYETVLRRKDGKLLHISSGVSPIINAAGRIVGASKIARDVTARKRAEEELRKLNADLEDRVTERTSELLATVEQSEKLQEQLLHAQKMESVGTLAGGIAHDFNNILNIIQGYTAVLQEQASRHGEIGESVAVINETVQRGSALVRQLLTLARKTRIHKESLDANLVIKKLLALIAQTFPKTIELESQLEADLPSIIADKNEIEQALLNICVNARDAMPHGGKLSFKSRTENGAGLLNLGGAMEGRYVCIEVSDTGMGMDDSVRKRIFEPFFTTKSTGQGTGLGLSVVYGIVKDHNGFVTVDSRPNSGASFRLYFPIVASPAAPGTSLVVDTQKRERTKQTGTIFIVEDEQRMLMLLEKILLEHGYAVLKATDGEMALKLYQRHKDIIDVVLLDLGLPLMAGREVLFRMKEYNANVKVVIASGYLNPELESEMHEAGVQHFLYKPYTLNQVVETLGRLMN